MTMQSGTLQAVRQGGDRLAERQPAKRLLLEGEESQRSAILWITSVIGRAAGDLPAELRARYPDAPWQEVIDVGRHVVEEYYAIDTNRAWRLLETRLEPFRAEI